MPAYSLCKFGPIVSSRLHLLFDLHIQRVSGTDTGVDIVQSLVYAVAEKAADMLKEDAD